MPQQAPTVLLLEITNQVLAARQQSRRVQGVTKARKSEPMAATRARPVNNVALKRLASVTDCVQACPVPSAPEKAPTEKEAYCWKATTSVMQ